MDMPTSHVREETNLSYIVLFSVQTVERGVWESITYALISQDPCQKNLKQLPNAPCYFGHVTLLRFTIPSHQHTSTKWLDHLIPCRLSETANFGTHVPVYTASYPRGRNLQTWATFCLESVWVDDRREELFLLRVPLAFLPLCCRERFCLSVPCSVFRCSCWLELGTRPFSHSLGSEGPTAYINRILSLLTLAMKMDAVSSSGVSVA
jgi:hypothetical protein